MKCLLREGCKMRNRGEQQFFMSHWSSLSGRLLWSWCETSVMMLYLLYLAPQVWEWASHRTNVFILSGDWVAPWGDSLTACEWWHLFGFSNVTKCTHWASCRERYTNIFLFLFISMLFFICIGTEILRVLSFFLFSKNIFFWIVGSYKLVFQRNEM